MAELPLSVMVTEVLNICISYNTTALKSLNRCVVISHSEYHSFISQLVTIDLYQGHNITIELKWVVAISHPEELVTHAYRL